MNFVIYEDEEKFINCYDNVITKLMGKEKTNYKIHKIDKYNDNSSKILNNISGNKIYILDIEVPGKNGIDLARQIRKSGDWMSPIIIVTSHEEFKIVGLTGKLLMLDFITKDKNIENNLIDALNIALKINSNKPTYNFKYKGEYYQIPYDDILYFEKSLNDNSCIIVCVNDEYVVRKTILEIEEELKNEIFFKTHRSCIVNIKKILKIDYDEGIIYFNDTKINLLSRSNKKILKEKMRDLNEHIF